MCLLHSYSNREVKICFCDNEDKNKLIKINNNKILCRHNPKNLDEIFIGTKGIMLFLISKIIKNENKRIINKELFVSFQPKNLTLISSPLK